MKFPRHYFLRVSGLGVCFAALTIACNRLSYPAGNVISLIIGTNFGWMVWPFLIGFLFSPTWGRKFFIGALGGSVSLLSSVLGYYLIDDIVIQKNDNFLSIFIETSFWSVLAIVTGFILGGLGAEAKSRTWRGITFLLLATSLITVERIVWYRRESEFLSFGPDHLTSTVWALASFFVVTLLILVWQLSGVRGSPLPNTCPGD